MTDKIIDETAPGLVVKEFTVRLSDEKLKNVMLRTYERAQKDLGVFKLHKLYSIMLSIASTLLLTLLTSSFNAIGPFTAEEVTKAAWLFFVASAIIGFLMLISHVNDKLKNDTSKRDKAVNEIFNKYFNKKQL